MIRFVCDNPDRILARVYATLRATCNCCTFYRGVLLGACLGGAIGALITAVLRG